MIRPTLPGVACESCGSTMPLASSMALPDGADWVVFLDSLRSLCDNCAESPLRKMVAGRLQRLEEIIASTTEALVDARAGNPEIADILLASVALDEQDCDILRRIQGAL